MAFRPVSDAPQAEIERHNWTGAVPLSAWAEKLVCIYVLAMTYIGSADETREARVIADAWAHGGATATFTLCSRL